MPRTKRTQPPLVKIQVRPGVDARKERARIAGIVKRALDDCEEAAYEGKRVKYGRSLLLNATFVAVTIIIPDGIINQVTDASTIKGEIKKDDSGTSII